MEENNEKIAQLEALVMRRELQCLKVLGFWTRRRPLSISDRRQFKKRVTGRFRKLEEARQRLSKEKREMKNQK